MLIGSKWFFLNSLWCDQLQFIGWCCLFISDSCICIRVYSVGCGYMLLSEVFHYALLVIHLVFWYQSVLSSQVEWMLVVVILELGIIMMIICDGTRRLLFWDDTVKHLSSPLQYVGTDQAPSKKVTADWRGLWDWVMYPIVRSKEICPHWRGMLPCHVWNTLVHGIKARNNWDLVQ